MVRVKRVALKNTYEKCMYVYPHLKSTKKHMRTTKTTYGVYGGMVAAQYVAKKTQIRKKTAK